MTTLRVVKSSASAGTSHIVTEGWTEAKMTAVCGTELKRGSNTQLLTWGQVSCLPCAQGWRREHP